MDAIVKVFVVSAALFASVSSHGQSRNPGDPNARQPDFAFGQLDKNNDGFLSRKEAAADKRTARLFNKADTNKDARLSEDELIKARSAEDRANAEQFTGDTAVTTKVKAALLTEPGIPSTAISVETYKGVVQLSGFVDDAAQVRKAGAVVAKVGGVKSVKNSLLVK